MPEPVTYEPVTTRKRRGKTEPAEGERTHHRLAPRPSGRSTTHRAAP